MYNLISNDIVVEIENKTGLKFSHAHPTISTTVPSKPTYTDIAMRKTNQEILL